uniref:Doublecortin domain containing 2B n=1 Tax=Anser cygnoides TaxID=8845 RepID=A0A8B9E9V6_ANSCY
PSGDEAWFLTCTFLAVVIRVCAAQSLGENASRFREQGKKFVVNQRRFLTFEAFLKEVTRSIHAPLAVRNLYTPRDGHRIAELGDLQDGCQYVAAGFEKFKRLNYLNQGRKELRGTSKSSGVQSRTVAPWRSNIATRRQKHTHLTIHVFRNGDLLSPPFRLLFSQSAPLQWDTLLATLTAKADLRSGAVNRLCRLDGTQVFGEEGLVNDGYYVAVGTEEYKKLPYFELLVPQDSACRTPRNHPDRRKKYSRKVGGSAGTGLRVLQSQLLLCRHPYRSCGCVQQSPCPTAMVTASLLGTIPKAASGDSCGHVGLELNLTA